MHYRRMGNQFRYNLAIFGSSPTNHGWIYLVKNGHLYKIGTTTNPQRRLHKDAKTWLPDMQILAVKPFFNAKELERDLHTGLAMQWYSGEWFKFDHKWMEEFFVETFSEFYDDDPASNSVDFIYWFNGNGFAEFTLDRSWKSQSLPKFQQETSVVKKEPTSTGKG